MHSIIPQLAVVTSIIYWTVVGAADSTEVIAEPSRCTVELNPGTIAVGIANKTFNDVPFCAYLGLRYAEPPVGELRFADPVLHHEPEGLRNYTAYGSVCAQFENINEQTEVDGDEDCLFINVFSPVPKGATIKYPVLVFIHGGSFAAGSGELRGVDLLMENEVIVVTLNYRLGVLGFLKHERYNITGNYGLKDQLVALQWLNQYVRQFGGDPHRVTLMGHSAGAGAVTHHLYNARAQPLFHGVMILGGSGLASWAFLYDHRKCVSNYMRDLGATTLTELRELDFQKFFIKDPKLRHAFAFSSMFYPCFIPTLDTNQSESAYFDRSVHQQVLVGSPPSMPVLVSETVNEFELLLKHVTDFWMSDNYPNNRHPTIKRRMWEVLEHLSNWAVYHGLEESKKRFYQKMANMANLRYPIRRLLNTLSSDPLYYMRFVFDGKFGENKRKTYAWYIEPNKYGAVHGDELSYIFSPYNLQEALTNRSEYRQELAVHFKTVELVTNFVKYGNPTPKRSKLSNVEWPPYNKAHNQTQYLNVDSEFTLRTVEDRRDMYYIVWSVFYNCLYYFDCQPVDGLEQLLEVYGVSKTPPSYDLDEQEENFKNNND
ncbi:esterase B1-like [Anopheles bellator]|uniref:esterase B1-like n=1 Tax=Anopheles bellator TaxID=139047 RepID=UPI0026495E7E|nr:esterase B1-like [Anopheles bellator]